MSRGYPKFLFSNPQNTRDKGPYVVHTLSPKALFKFIPSNSEEYSAENLSKYLFYYSSPAGDLIMIQDDPNCEPSDKEDLCTQAWKWLMHYPEFQRYMKEVKVPL